MNSIKSEAFALIKETAKRFNDNESISVSSTQFDTNLSETANYVNIDGDSAIWDTSWSSGGVHKKWDMVHYDVQLIG